MRSNIHPWILGFSCTVFLETASFTAPLNAEGLSDHRSRHTILDKAVVINTDDETLLDHDDPSFSIYLNEFATILMDHPKIATVRVTGTGGYEGLAWGYIEKIREFDLNTEAVGRCTSSCALMFVAGKHRRLLDGAVLGFHGAWWSQDAIASYYPLDEHSNSYEIANKTYVDGLHVASRTIRFLVNQGVDVDFAADAQMTGKYDMLMVSHAEADQFGITTN